MEQQEKIERYLKGLMTTSDRRAFEKEMAANSVLSEAVAFEKERMSFFESYEPALEAQLSALGDQYFVEKPVSQKPSIYIWWVILPLLILSACLYLWLNSSSPKIDAFPIEKTLESLPDVNEDQIKDTLHSKDELIPEEVDINSESSSPKQEETTKINRPIASLNEADFKPNPALENLISENVRNENVTIVTIPPSDKEYAAQKSIPLVIKGTSTAKPPYQLVVYSNRPFDFDNDHRVLNRSISGKAQEKEYQFEFRANIPFEAGLYYLIILGKEEQILHGGRFIVK
jgi:hypothetical protein